MVHSAAAAVGASVAGAAVGASVAALLLPGPPGYVGALQVAYVAALAPLGVPAGTAVAAGREAARRAARALLASLLLKNTTTTRQQHGLNNQRIDFWRWRHCQHR